MHGSKLMSHFIDQARKAGVPGIHLATKSDNLSAQDFFSSQGFRHIGGFVAFRRSSGKFLEVPIAIMGKYLD